MWNSTVLPSVVLIRRITPGGVLTARIPTVVFLISQFIKAVFMRSLRVPALTRVTRLCHGHSSKVFFTLGVIVRKAFQRRCFCGTGKKQINELLPIHVKIFIVWDLFHMFNPLFYCLIIPHSNLDANVLSVTLTVNV